MTIHTENLAVISTAHVTADEGDALTAHLAEDLGGMKRDYGWLLPTRSVVSGRENLSFVIGYMKAKGFDWILFDCDAPHADDLTVYEW